MHGISKMKTVLLTTHSCSAKYIAHQLHQNGFLAAVIIENSISKNKKNLIQKIFSSGWLQFPVKLLDFFSVYVYSKLCNRYLSKHLLSINQIDGFPENTTIHRVENASGAKCISILKKLEPAILVVLGTSLLSKDVLAIAKEYSLNIHGGIVPQYRNVHSDFWAFIFRDHDNIGTSIIHLDRGIDTGDVALQSSIEVDAQDTIYSIKKKNLILAGNLVIKTIGKAIDDSLPKVPQSNTQKGFYHTPGFADFFRLLRENFLRKQHSSQKKSSYNPLPR